MEEGWWDCGEPPSAWQSSCPAARGLLYADSRVHLLWVGSDVLTVALLTLREEGGGGE